MIQALAEHSLEKCSVLTAERFAQINRYQFQYHQKFDADPTIEEIATHLDISKETVEKIMGLFQRVSFQSLTRQKQHEILMRSGETGESSDIDENIHQKLRDEVLHAFSSLTKREQTILSMFFGLDGEHPLSLEEIGARFPEKIGRERVRQIKEVALRKLRHPSRASALLQFTKYRTYRDWLVAWRREITGEVEEQRDDTAVEDGE